MRLLEKPGKGVRIGAMRSLLCLMMLGMVAGAGPALKVMTWNLHHGVGEDGRLDLERVAAKIVSEKPDLVALQEIDRNCARSGSVDQAAELGRLTGMKATFGKAMDLGKGEYGQAVLSKLPIVSSKVHKLPSQGEPRIALELRVTFEDTELRFVTVHLDYEHDAIRLAQAQEVKKVLEGEWLAVLCGDFNDVADSAALKVFTAPWITVEKQGSPLTYPAGKPETEIDHMLIRGLKIVEKARVLDEKIASDHRPVVATVSRN